MEYFELSFFFNKKDSSEEILAKLDELFKENMLFKKNDLVECFNEEGRDFAEVIISLSEFVITKDNLKDKIKNISAFVSTVFEQIVDISFATGVYELTYYFIENAKVIGDFDNGLYEKFPIVFLRPTNNYNFGQIIFSNDNLVCIFNENAQKLY